MTHDAGTADPPASHLAANTADEPRRRPSGGGYRDLNVLSTHVVFDIDAVLEPHGSLVGLPPSAMII